MPRNFSSASTASTGFAHWIWFWRGTLAQGRYDNPCYCRLRNNPATGILMLRRISYAS
jgi:hypothetical protein